MDRLWLVIQSLIWLWRLAFQHNPYVLYILLVCAYFIVFVASFAISNNRIRIFLFLIPLRCISDTNFSHTRLSHTAFQRLAYSNNIIFYSVCKPYFSSNYYKCPVSVCVCQSVCVCVSRCLLTRPEKQQHFVRYLYALYVKLCEMPCDTKRPLFAWLPHTTAVVHFNDFVYFAQLFVVDFFALV